MLHLYQNGSKLDKESFYEGCMTMGQARVKLETRRRSEGQTVLALMV